MSPDGMQQNLARLVAAGKLRSAPDGDIEILTAFWHFDSETNTPVDPPGTVPPLLVYADLMASMDPRNFEIARLIHDEKLKDAKHDGAHATP